MFLLFGLYRAFSLLYQLYTVTGIIHSHLLSIIFLSYLSIKNYLIVIKTFLHLFVISDMSRLVSTQFPFSYKVIEINIPL